MCTQEHNTDNHTQTLLFGCSDRSRALIQESLIRSLSWDSPGPPSCLPVFPLFLSYIVRSVAIRSERKRGMKCCFVSRRSWREGGKERMRECEECGGVSKWLFRELWSVCGTLLVSRVCVCVCVWVSKNEGFVSNEAPKEPHSTNQTRWVIKQKLWRRDCENLYSVIQSMADADI